MTDRGLRTAVAVPGSGAGDSTRVPRRAWVLFAIVVLGQFMANLDVAIVNVAVPDMQADLHASGAGMQFAVAGYTIVYAVLLITGARLGEIRGRRWAFLTGLGMFTAASLLCGLAWSTAVLVVFRCAQGAGSALMVPQVLATIQRQFTGQARARALGVFAAVIACGAVCGQVVGGVLVSADLFGEGWRPVFLVNVPIGAVLLAVGWRMLPGEDAAAGGAARRLDVVGVLVLCPAVFAIITPLMLGHQEHWPLWGWLLMVAGAVLFGLFAVVERGVERRGGNPLVHGRVVRAPGLLRFAVTQALGVATYSGFLFVLALHLQTGRGDSALRAGLTVAPCAVAFAVTSMTWQRVPVRYRPTLVVCGLVVAAMSDVGMGLLLRGGGSGGPGLYAVIGAMGLGLGAAMGPLMSMGLAHVDPKDAGDASGVLATIIQVGGAVGIAGFGTLFLSLTGAGAHASGRAVEWTSTGMAAAVLVAGAGMVPVALRRRSQA